MAQRSTNTLIELLQRWAADAGQASLTLPADDADVARQLLEVFRQLLDQKATQQQTGGAPQPGPQPGPMGGGGVPGVMPGPGSISPDELHRQLAMTPGGNF